MNNRNFYSIPRETGKLDSTAFNTPEGTILGARECCGLFHVSDSGGGIANALDIIGEDPFLMISGDTWSDFDLSTLSLNEGNMAHLILIENPKDKPDGDMFLHNGKVNSKRNGKCLTFSGMALIDPKLFLNVKKSKFELWEEILLPASDQQLVTGELYSGSVININSIEDIKKLDAYLREE